MNPRAKEQALDETTLGQRIEEAARRRQELTLGEAARTQGEFIDSVVRCVELVADQLREVQARLQDLEGTLAAVAAEASSRHHDLSRQLTEMALYVLRREGAAPPPAPSPIPLDYLAFESRLRGSRQEIMRRQRVYLDLFLDRQKVLDLGCGRGEFVELLTERGVDVLGVDANPEMVALCQRAGLSVVLGDALHFLAGHTDTPVDGIFAAQMIEHLLPEQVLELIRSGAEALPPGGLLVLETINPACPSALADFYLDPTHVRPVPAGLVRFFLEQSGFSVGCFLFSSPVDGSHAAPIREVRSENPRVDEYADYAVVATRL